MVSNILTGIAVLLYSVITLLGLIVGYLLYLFLERIVRKWLTIEAKG